MAAFCADFLDQLDDSDMDHREDQQAEPEERTPEPKPKKRRMSSDDSLSSQPKIAKRDAAARACAAMFSPGAHNAPERKRGKDKKPRAARGSRMTFAGRRPPQDPHKLECFNLMKEDYKNLKTQCAKSKKKISYSQNAYWDFMRTALNQKGPECQKDKFAAAAKRYRESLGLKQ